MATTVEKLMVEVQADVRKALSELGRLERRTDSMGSRMGRLARSTGMAFGGAAVASGIVKTINLAKTFDLTMRQVGVQTGKTGVKLAGLSDLALKMGKDTVFSAQDAGKAMLDLAKGGLSAAQIRAGALETTLLLAAAGGLDLADSAGYVTQGLTTFGLKAAKANQVAVALAGGANASTASVESLGMALSQVGPGAVNAGFSLQETVAALAAFDNAGIKGSDAGTSLKTMLAALVPTTNKARSAMTKYGLEFVDAKGNFKSLTQISESLKNGLGDLSEAQRVQALKTIFGSDATRAATVLMRNGEKGMSKYLKATKDQTAAQDMANTAMEGASGAWENFKGTLETAGIQLGTKFLPMVEDALKWGSEFVNDASGWGPQVDESFGWMIDAAKDLVPPLKLAVDLAQVGADAFGALPDPVKQIGIQVGIAALVFPKLAAGAASVSAQFTRASAAARTFGADLRSAETRSGRLQGAAKNLAGIGGLALLASSAGDTEGALKDLKRTSGLTAVAFSVAGPWGAAVTAFVSILGTAQSAGEEFGLSQEDMAAQIDLVTESLNRQTGAFTRRTRQQVVTTLGEEGVLSTLKEWGIALPQVTAAVMDGSEGVEKFRNKAMGMVPADQRAKLVGLTETMYDLATSLESGQKGFMLEREAMGKSGRAIQQHREDVRRYAQTWDLVPSAVRTIVKEMGADASRKNVKALAKAYDTTPRIVRTLFRVLGADKAKGDAKGVKNGLEAVGKVPANLDKWLAGIGTGVKRGKDQATKGGKDAKDGLEKPIKSTKADLSGLHGSIRTGANAAKPIASSGGQQIGSALSVGIASGVRASANAIAEEARVAVRTAIGAAKAEAKIHSPSRRMRDEVGAQMGKGMEQGLADREKALRAKGRDLARAVVRGAREGWASTRKTLAQIAKWAKADLAGKAEDRMLARVKNTNDRLKGLYDRRIQMEKRLDDAQAMLDRRRASKAAFVGSTVQGMTSQANVLNAGNTASAIAASLTTQVAKVKKFARLLKRLHKMGWARTIIQQIAAAGVEGGMAAALALASASSTDQATINDAYAQIHKTAQTTAKALGGAMYDAGIEAAAGIVEGLKRRRKGIQNTILDIAAAMQEAIRRAVGLGNGNGNGGGGNGNGNRPAAGRIGVGDVFGASPATARTAQAAVASQFTFIFHTYNSVAEPQSRTTNKALARVSGLGLV